MARYIDADKLIAHLKDELKGCHLPFGSRVGGKSIAYGTILGLKSAISFAATLPTEDVVPKSEVDLYRKQVDELEDELSSTYDKLENANTEVAREIFEEIAKLAYRFMNDEHYIFGDMLWDIIQLKKKYIQD